MFDKAWYGVTENIAYTSIRARLRERCAGGRPRPGYGGFDGRKDEYLAEVGSVGASPWGPLEQIASSTFGVTDFVGMV